MSSKVDDTICPLCQVNNHCGINSTEPCWCVESDIQPDLLKQVPAELSRKSCICKNCIDKFNRTKITKKP